MLKKSKTKFGYFRKILVLPLLFAIGFIYMVNAKNKEIETTNKIVDKMVENYMNEIEESHSKQVKLSIMKKVEENHRFLVWTSAAISKVLGKSVGVSLLILGKQIQKTQVPVKSEAVDAALQLGGKLVTDKK